MFTALRYIAYFSFALVLLGTAALGYFTNVSKQEEIERESRRTLDATLHSYTTFIWNRYHAELTKNRQSPYLPQFFKETSEFFQKYDFLMVQIAPIDVLDLNVKSGKPPKERASYYLAQKSTEASFSDSGGKAIQIFESSRQAMDQNNVKAGSPVIQTLKKINVTTGQLSEPRTIIHAILPLAHHDPANPAAVAPPEAYVEIYFDITNRVATNDRNFLILMGSVIAMSALLIGALLLTASKAEGIISKQHEVNLELIAAAAQAEAQSRDKSQFLASVSHELRTPLNAVIGFSDIIRNEAKDKLEKIHQEYLDDINASGRHLLSLINDILDFSKAEAGKLQLEWAEADVTKIIRNSLRMVLPRAEAAQVTLVEDLPSQHLVVVTDAKKLKQVLLNLLSNAVKFTPAGGEVRCHAWVDVVTGAVNIQVRDTGIGIAPKDISRVMTPFGQVDSALSRKYEGTGLGLPLSKKFVESMGGNFAIESQVKVGTSVTITVPKAPAGWGNPVSARETLTPEDENVARTNSDA